MTRLIYLSHRLWFRLTAAFVLVALVGVICVALLADRATSANFQRYLNAGQTSAWEDIAGQLEALYARQGNWADAEAILTAASGPGRGQGGAFYILAGMDGQEIARSAGRRGLMAGMETEAARLPIEAGGQQVATLLVGGMGAGMGMNRAAEQFLADVNRAIWIGGSVALLLALVLGMWLAYRLTRPIEQLTLATQRMEAGDLRQQVTVSDQGELGELAASFNAMAGRLALTEQQRQQMLADVAHELRTPLSILRGQLEAMLDGVFSLTPDNLAVAHEETILLGRLVDDLRTLSLAEAGQLPLARQSVDPVGAVQKAVAAFAPLYEAEGVILATTGPDSLPKVDVDPERLQQVLGNLLANALRYAPKGSATPAVELSAEAGEESVTFGVRDNGPGLTPEAQAHIFDRFWRGEPARDRQSGGSGLGLAICRAIVLAHGGRIAVESAPGAGTRVVFNLPSASTETKRSF